MRTETTPAAHSFLTSLRNRAAHLGALVGATLALGATSAQAQDPEAGDNGWGDMATEPPPAAAPAPRRASASRSYQSTPDLRIEAQARWTYLNTIGSANTGLGSAQVGVGSVALAGAPVPQGTAGVRMMGGDLFLGLGLGYYRLSTESVTELGDSTTTITSWTSGWSLVPTASYDILASQGDDAALYGIGFLNLAQLGGGDTTEEDTNGAGDLYPDVEPAFYWGLSLGAGLRAKLAGGVSVFTELGWTLLQGSREPTETLDYSETFQGLWGSLGISLDMGL